MRLLTGCSLIFVLCTLLISTSHASPRTLWDLSYTEDDPYYASISKLADAGIIVGFPNGSFDGARPVTRGDLAVIIARMMMYYEASLPKALSLSPLPRSTRSAMKTLTPEIARKYLLSHQVYAVTGTEYVSEDEVVESLSSAFTKLIDLSTSPGTE